MTYEPQEWKNGPAGGTPITAERLNHLEQGVKGVADEVAGKAEAEHTHTVGDIDATGTPSEETFLRGDGTWAHPPTGGDGGGGAVSSVNGKTGDVVLDVDDIPELPASKIGSGFFSTARIPPLSQSKVTGLTDSLAGKAALEHTHTVGDIDAAGAPSDATFLRGDGTWAPGPKGDPGQDGAPGADGQDGADGADGASAYEVAVANGFVGTEAEWLASLVGPKGDPGEKGDDGAGVPAGGAAGQVLAKATAADHDTQWIDPPTGGGGAVSSVNGKTGDVVLTGADIMVSGEVPLSVLDALVTFGQEIPEQRVYGGRIFIQETPPASPEPGDIHLW